MSPKNDQKIGVASWEAMYCFIDRFIDRVPGNTLTNFHLCVLSVIFFMSTYISTGTAKCGPCVEQHLHGSVIGNTVLKLVRPVKASFVLRL